MNHLGGLKKTNMPKVTDDESRGALLTETREDLHDCDLRLAWKEWGHTENLEAEELFESISHLEMSSYAIKPI